MRATCHLRSALTLNAFLIAGLLPAPAAAQCSQARLVTDVFPNEASAYLSDLATEGDLVAVARKGNAAHGVVTVHQRQGTDWVQIQVLEHPTVGLDMLSGDLEMAGGWLAIGNVNQASVVLFEWTPTGFESRGVLHGDPAALSFGESVALNPQGTRLAVGSAHVDVGGVDRAGEVVVFDRVGSTWIEVDRLHMSPLEEVSGFGHSVAVDGDLIAVGAYGANPGIKGMVQVFRDTGGGSFQVEARVRADDSVASPSSGFGWALELEGNRLAVSAPFTGLHSARVYLYQWSGTEWLPEHSFANGIGTEFGKSIDLSGDLLVVGEHNTSMEAKLGGALHLYRRDPSGWNHTTSMAAPDVTPGLHFGQRVAIAGERVLVSGISLPAQNVGGAYAIDNAWTCPATPLGNQVCVAPTPNSSGQAATLEAYGSLTPSHDLLGLRSHQLPVDQAGLLIASLTPGNSPMGQGTLCLGGAFARVRVEQTDALGRLHFRMPLDAVPTPPQSQPILGGQTWYFQCVYRDQNPLPTFNFSPALELMFQ
ncbi:MAG: hypothetical protein ACI8QC_000151 [Planctomycetota bacterium]|jgi:hypothetical protein